jgi:hypothetical protein
LLLGPITAERIFQALVRCAASMTAEDWRGLAGAVCPQSILEKYPLVFGEASAAIDRVGGSSVCASTYAKMCRPVHVYVACPCVLFLTCVL